MPLADEGGFYMDSFVYNFFEVFQAPNRVVQDSDIPYMISGWVAAFGITFGLLAFIGLVVRPVWKTRRISLSSMFLIMTYSAYWTYFLTADIHDRIATDYVSGGFGLALVVLFFLSLRSKRVVVGKPLVSGG